MLKIMFIKYALGACKRKCHKCDYSNVCSDNYSAVSWYTLIKYFLYIRWKILLK